MKENKIYQVTRLETEHYHCYIEAENKEEAERIAEDNHNIYWRNNHDFEAEVIRVEVAEKEDLRGKIIETDKEPFSYEEKA